MRSPAHGRWATAVLRKMHAATRSGLPKCAGYPSIKLIATGSFSDFLNREHSWNGDLRWNESLLRHGGPNLECISLHALPENHRGFPAGHTNRDIFKASGPCLAVGAP